MPYFIGMSLPPRDSGDTILSCLDAGSLGRRVVTALPTMFARGVSLHDATGHCHWRSAGEAGPSEHIAVRAAQEAFVGQTAPARADQNLMDGTTAILLNSRSSSFEFAGFVMLIVPTSRLRSVGRAAPDLPIPVIRAARHWGDLAAMHAAANAPANKSANASTAEHPAAVVGDTVIQPVTLKELAGERTASERIERVRCAEALRKFPIALVAQRLMPLHADTRIRRYEILLRGGAEHAPDNAPHALLRDAEVFGLGAVLDRRVVTALVSWLRQHEQVWTAEPSQFSVNLSLTSLADPNFMQYARIAIDSAALPPGTIVFEIDQHRARDEYAQISALAEACRSVNTGLVLDNFTLHNNSVDLLMLPGLRLLKLDRKLTTELAKSRSGQAVVAGIAQMARVAGVHSVAKQIESTDEHALLAELGVDFVQSFASSAPVALDTLRTDITRRTIVDAAIDEYAEIPAYLAAQPR